MEEVSARYQYQGQLIEEIMGAMTLATCAGTAFSRNQIEPGGCVAYRNNLLAATGQPTDPIEVMLVEQLMLAHHRIGVLHIRAAEAATPERAALYNAAAVRLMGEFRKTSLALREYRTPVVPKQVTVVKQQNVAAGDQQVAYLDGKSARPSATTTNRDIELVSNDCPEALTHVPQSVPIPQPQASRSRTAEPVPARSVEPARPRAIAARGPCEPAVGALDRSKDRVR